MATFKNSNNYKSSESTMQVFLIILLNLETKFEKFLNDRKKWLSKNEKKKILIIMTVNNIFTYIILSIEKYKNNIKRFLQTCHNVSTAALYIQKLNILLAPKH